MADTLDSLQIKIQADAKSATNNLDKTADALERLAKTVDSFNVGKFKSIASSMGNIANAFPKGNRVASSIKNVAGSLNSMASVNPLKLMMTANAMKTMSSGASSASKASKNLSKSIKSMPSATSSASKGFTSFASVIGKFYATYFLLIRALGMFRKAIDISSSLTEVENVVNQSFGNMSSKLNEFTKTSMHDFGLSELSAKTFASRYQAMGVAMGFAEENMADMSISLTKLVGDMSSFYNVSQEAVAEDLQSIFTGSTRPMRAYGMDLTEATLKSYALSKGMNANIDSMIQMEKTMLRYTYVMDKSGMAQGDFLRTFDTWANRTRYLSQQFQAFGAIVGQILIHVLKPLLRGLNLIMESAINMANTVLNALGQIFGWEYEISGGAVSQIADDSEIMADGFDDASKSAKKLKNSLQGFNELNVIGKNDNSASSSTPTTSGGASGGYTTSTKPIDSLMEKYKSKITSLEELGSTISNALYKAMTNIDWNGIFEKASNFGKGLADFLNGLITPETFSALGSTLANGLNTLSEAIFDFIANFDWLNFIYSLLRGLGGFLGSLDTKTIIGIVGIATFKKFGGAFGGAILEHISPSNIGKKITKELFKNLDFSSHASAAMSFMKILEKIGKWFVGIPALLGGGFLAISKFFEMWEDGFNLIDWLIETVGLALVGFGLAVLGVVTGPVAAIGVAIGAVASALALLIHDNWDAICDFVSNAFNNVVGFISRIPVYVSNFLGQIPQIFSLVLYSAWKIVGDMLESIRQRFGDVFYAIGKIIANSIINGINGMIKAVEDGLNGFIFIINLMIMGVNNLLKSIAKFTGSKFSGFGLLGGVSFPRIPQYATGGFPEDGLFYANHDELVGQFSNGNTAVANNQQIIQGIQSGVRDAITGAMIPYLSRMVVSLEEIERKEFGISGESVFDSVRKSNRDYYRRTGESAFVY